MYIQSAPTQFDLACEQCLLNYSSLWNNFAGLLIKSQHKWNINFEETLDGFLFNGKKLTEIDIVFVHTATLILVHLMEKF